jgi:hypothetical protein
MMKHGASVFMSAASMETIALFFFQPGLTTVVALLFGQHAFLFKKYGPF